MKHDFNSGRNRIICNNTKLYITFKPFMDCTSFQSALGKTLPNSRRKIISKGRGKGWMNEIFALSEVNR